MKKLLPIALLLSLLASCNIVPSLNVTPRYGPLDMSGDLSVSSGGSSGRSTADDLGIKEEGVFQPRVEFSWGGADITATGFQSEFRGRGTAAGMFDIGGTVISGGEDVDTALDLAVYSLVGTWDFVPTSLVDVGVGLGVTAVDFDASITSLSSSETVRSADQFVLPVLAARAQTEVGPFRANLQWNGLMGSYGGTKANYHDIDLYGEYRWFSFAGVHGAAGVGFRILITDFEYQEMGSDVDGELNFTGFYFGLTLGV